MTAVQLPGNWFELADERCCYTMACSVYCWHAVTADTVPVFIRATDRKCIYIRLRRRSHSSGGSNFVWTATDNQPTVKHSIYGRKLLRFWPKTKN